MVLYPGYEYHILYTYVYVVTKTDHLNEKKGPELLTGYTDTSCWISLNSS